MGNDITVVEFETFVWYYTHLGPIDAELCGKFRVLSAKLRDEILAYPIIRDLDE